MFLMHQNNEVYTVEQVQTETVYVQMTGSGSNITGLLKGPGHF